MLTQCKTPEGLNKYGNSVRELSRNAYSDTMSRYLSGWVKVNGKMIFDKARISQWLWRTGMLQKARW